MIKIGKHAFVFGLVLLFFIPTISSEAQTSVTKIQSLYIYNFAKYIKWSNGGAEVNVGIYATEKNYDEIAGILSSRKVAGAPIKVTRLTRPNQAAGQQIVFVGQSYNWTFKKIAEAGMKNMLLVTEVDFIRRGASISFVLRNSRLKFKINKEACERSGLIVSNNLISLGV